MTTSSASGTEPTTSHGAPCSYRIASPKPMSAKGFAYCPYAVNHFTSTHQLVPVTSAQPGDIVFFNWSGKGGIAEHVGLVVSNNIGSKLLTTYEGNTATPGAVAGNESNGDGCYQKVRQYEFVVAVARPKWAN